MLKITKLNRKDLLDEISQLRQQVIELQSEVIRLKNMSAFPSEWEQLIKWQPYPYTYPWMPDDSTGDPLPIMPNTTCEVRVY